MHQPSQWDFLITDRGFFFFVVWDAYVDVSNNNIERTETNAMENQVHLFRNIIVLLKQYSRVKIEKPADQSRGQRFKAG